MLISHPVAASRSRFIATKRNHPCPLCSDISGKCRQTDALYLCMTIEANDAPPGFKFIGRTKDQLWSKFVVDDGRTPRAAQFPAPRTRRILPQASRPPALDAAERSTAYHQLLDALTLHPADRADLHRRGLTDAQIEAWGVKSVEQWHLIKISLPTTLPGVSADGCHLNCQPGYLCPISNVEGQLVGFQIRLRDGENGRYRWLTSTTRKSPHGPTPHLPNGELPLAVHRPIEIKRRGIALVEGVGAKPFLTAHRREQVVVGAAGGQFASSPQTLKTTLDRLAEELETMTIEFYPDAGAIHNRHVMRQYRTTWNLLKKWGYAIQVAWWQQDTKAGPDIDELEDFTPIHWLSTAQLEALAHPRFEWLERIQKSLNKTPQPQVAAAALRRWMDCEQSVYLPGQRLTVWQAAIQQGYRYILDASAPGAGKSYDAGRIEPSAFAAQQVIYASDQHRNPTVSTLTLDNGWIDLEARHGGLLQEITPGGGIRLKRASRAQPPHLPANCSRHQLLNTLRQKYVQGSDTAALICSTCPLREVCTHAEGVGYGFLYQRHSALSSPRLRAHLDSLPDPHDYSLSETILLIDEPGQNFRVKQDLQVTLTDLEQVIVRLMDVPELFEALQPLLVALIPLLDGSVHPGKFGIAHPDLIQHLPTVEVDLDILTRSLHPDLSFLNTTAEYGVDLADLPRQLRKQFSERDPDLAEQAQKRVIKQWLPDLIRILQGTHSGGSLRLGYDGLTLTLPDARHRSIVEAAKATIFLDGTLHPQDLALKLGCKIEDIFVCRQQIPHAENLKIIQVTDLGRLGMQRGNEQQRRVNALLAHYHQQDGVTRSIDFKKFASPGSGCWWRDSRGVNDFEATTRLILIGTPCRNLADLQAEYAICTGTHPQEDDPQFRAFVDRSILAEFHQALGRLRAHRRPETPLEIILLSDFALDCPTQAVKASDITLDASTKRERFLLAVQQAAAQLQATGAKLTQSAISALIPYSQQYVSQHWTLLQTLLDPSHSNGSKNSDPSNAANEAMAAVLESALATCNNAADVLATVTEIFHDWVDSTQWNAIWEPLSGSAQVAILTALTLTLPPPQIEQLVY